MELWGEGYFEVAKEKNRPFVVDLGDINVKVTGTKFNVKAYTAESNLWVTLDEGGVLLKDERQRISIASGRKCRV